MDTLSPEQDAARTTAIATQPGRVDLYAGIHKALPLMMARTLASSSSACVAIAASSVGSVSPSASGAIGSSSSGRT